MLVYQVIERSGEWEDYYEHVIGTYLDKDKAEDKKRTMDNQVAYATERYDRCCSCNEEEEPCFTDSGDGYCMNAYDYHELIDTRYVVREFKVIE